MSSKSWYTYSVVGTVAPDSSHGNFSEKTFANAHTNTTTTGWVVGTTGSGYYSPAIFATKSSLATFGIVQKPSSPPTTNDCFRSEIKYYGYFSPGTWTINITCISGTATNTGSGRFNIRLWKSSNPTGSSATEITDSVIVTTAWSNLTTSASQVVTANFSLLNNLEFNGEYLFFQIALEILTAGSNPTAELFIKGKTGIDATDWKLAYDGLYIPNQDWSVLKVLREDSPIDGDITEITTDPIAPPTSYTYYIMRAKYQSSYITWEVGDQPDITGAQSGANPTDLSDIVVINTKTVII